MKYDELRWTFNDDELEPNHTSQRLRPIHMNGAPLEHLPRVYIKRWESNRFTIIWVHPFNNACDKYERGLDLADVAVRLLKLMEDERQHKTFKIYDPIY